MALTDVRFKSFNGTVSNPNKFMDGPLVAANLAAADGTAFDALTFGTTEQQDLARYALQGIRANPQTAGLTSAQAVALAQADAVAVAAVTSATNYNYDALAALRANPAFTQNSSTEIAAIVANYASVMATVNPSL
jgi:hypothetical protein